MLRAKPIFFVKNPYLDCTNFQIKNSNMKKYIPNALTSGNILCGCLGIIQCFEGNLQQAVYWMAAGAMFDFFDGFAARAFKVSGDMGKELDSLADMVSFGVLPSFILFQLIQPLDNQWSYAALLVAIFSGLRLAKFNIDTRQTDSFIGLPTPANALFIGALPFIFEQHPQVTAWLRQLPVLVGIAVVMSALLVAELPLIALKFKAFRWKNNEYRFLLIGISILLLIFLQFSAIPLIILLYVLLSVLQHKL